MRYVAACLLLAPVLAVAQDAAEPAGQAVSEPGASQSLPPVQVRGLRPYEAGPMPGLMLRREQIPANVQSADKAELKRSRALNIGEFMNQQMPSVAVNDYSGNPFQMDVSYRGFTASPQIGTPQGLSVFFDGVRVNEPFGDVVNWDLLPMNAIERFDVFPGSNPLFGLNTLGGALSLRSKSGFSAPGLDASLQIASHGRRQLQLAGGHQAEDLAGFAALTHFEERGWRANSPTQVSQLFLRADMRRPWGSAGISLLAAGNDLIGNGLIPYELWQTNPRGVFTSPDQTRNRLLQGRLSGTLEVSETFNVTGQVYRRKSVRRALNGDIYEGFDEFEADVDRPRFGRRPQPDQSLPPCAFPDLNRDGQLDWRLVEDPGNPGNYIAWFPIPYNDPEERGLCDPSTHRVVTGPPRNGKGQSGDAARGWIDGTPTGLLSKSAVDQLSDGGSVQLNWNLPRHTFMLGASIDASATDYRMAQRLGLIDASHQVYEAPDLIDTLYRAAQVDVRANDFNGTSRTRSLYFSETWSPRDHLHLTLAGRYNHTRVNTTLLTRSAIGFEAGDLHNLRNFNVVRPRWLCPGPDLASCPPMNGDWTVLRDVTTLASTPTVDRMRYESFNPSVGWSWQPSPMLNLFGNLSRGTRVPSVVELGCAYDDTLVNINAGRTDDETGAPVAPVYRPRSLVGPTCTLPTTLSGDPFLPQITSVSGELGARGRLGVDWEWNASVYRTDLKDDIFFIGVSAERSFFDTIGKTRRKGLELGLKGRLGETELRLNYAYTEATFESRFHMLSPHNSSADFDQNSVPDSPLPTDTAFDNGNAGTYRMIRIDPGARMPGIPLHNLNASLAWQATPALRIALSAVGHSSSFVRGNENNAHQPGGTDGETTKHFQVCGPNGTNCTIFGGERLAGRPFRLRGRVPGFMVVNLATTLQLGSGLSLTCGVNNLFDRRYFTAGRLGFNPFSPSVQGAIGPSGWNYNSGEWQNTAFVGPGAPRSFALTLSVELGGP